MVVPRKRKRMANGPTTFGLWPTMTWTENKRTVSAIKTFASASGKQTHPRCNWNTLWSLPNSLLSMPFCWKGSRNASGWLARSPCQIRPRRSRKNPTQRFRKEMLILSDLSDILMHLVLSRAGTAKHNVLPIVLWHCKPGCSCAQQVKEQKKPWIKW